MKRLMIFAMTMALCLSVFSLTASAEDVTNAGSFQDLKNALEEASLDPAKPTQVQLTADIDSDSALFLPKGYVVLDLNGHKIDRNLTEETSNGYVFRVNGGELTVKDSSKDKTGKITGGYCSSSSSNNFASGVDVIAGNFILESGSITGNKGYYQVSVHSMFAGDAPVFIMKGGCISENNNFNVTNAAVYVKKGTFKMSGGIISDNPDYGVYVESESVFEMSGDARICGNNCGVNLYNAEFSMTGGEISSNKYGVYGNNYTFNVSGSPRITGNKNTDGKDCNLFFSSYDNSFAVNITAPLSNGALIGVRMEKNPAEDTPKIIAKGTADHAVTDSDLACFKSDDIDYSIEKNESGELQLYYDPVVLYDLYVAGTRVNSKNAADLSVIDGVTGNASYDPDTNTLNLNGVTITNSESKSRAHGIQYVGESDFTISSKGKNKISVSGKQKDDSAGIAMGKPGEYGPQNNFANLVIDIGSKSTLTAIGGYVQGGYKPVSYGVAYSCSGKITIKGSGTLNAGSSEADIGYGIFTVGDLIIKDKVTVNAETKGTVRNIAIANNNDVYFSGNPTINAIASDASDYSYGLETGNLYISGGNITAIGGVTPVVETNWSANSVGLRATSGFYMEEDDPRVIARGQNIGLLSDNINISSGWLSADGLGGSIDGSDEKIGVGIYSDETISLEGEKTVVEAKGTKTSMLALEEIVINKPLIIIKPDDGVIGLDKTTICGIDGQTNATDVLIRKPTPSPSPTKAAAASLTLDKKTATVICGKKLTLKATLKNSNSKISWKSSDTKIATVDSNGKITAKKAGQITITATAAGKSAKCTVTVLYKDVIDSSEFWYAPTNYLTAKNVVKGYADQTEFRPANDCTRAQMVTFLYRLQGEPKTKTTICKFDDVKSADYFYKPVIWAVENGITTGVSAKKFEPQKVCTRAQTVTFLWRMAGKPDPKGGKDFPDVEKTDYFYKATLWASEMKILAGLPNGKFDPQGKCLRRQMVTFLYKYDKYVNGKG